MRDDEVGASAAAVHVVILAGGRGTRMGTRTPKVLLPLAGLPLLERVLRTTDAINPGRVTAILGYSAEEMLPLFRRRQVHVVTKAPILGPSTR